MSLEGTRPTVRSAKGVVAAGHLFASIAGLDILRRGGNAIDAGVAAGICVNILHHDMTSFSGVAPIMVYLAEEKKVISISGLGRWPKASSLEYFWEEQDGLFVDGIAHCVIPAAPDAWATVLARYGTMSLADVMEAAIGYARDGFPVHDFMAASFKSGWSAIQKWPGSVAVVAPDGELVGAGDMLVQPDLANTLQSMADAECADNGNRESGIQAGRDEFYKGAIAEKFVKFSEENGGFFTLEDFSEFAVKEEPTVVVEFGGYQVHTCDAWCQGPVLAQALSILKNFDLKSMGHNSPKYIHTVAEALNLAFADREFYYGDPEFVDVPMDELVSDSYGRLRADLIRDGKAWGELPPPGDPRQQMATRSDYQWPPAGDWLTVRKAMKESPLEPDTSHVCVVDASGNMFSATPSDTFTTHLSPPLVPGVGLPLSGRGRQSRLDPNHPAAIAPWKRPRLTPSPAIVLKDGMPFMTVGTPGGDIQPQAMLQVFLNVVLFGMAPQAAVEAPRFGSYSHPNSFYPHGYKPGMLRIESRVDASVMDQLRDWGHTVEAWPERTGRAGSVLISGIPLQNGTWQAAADNRRESIALGW
jgi:gamma-glutamyltranspeptidase/glutathione hydrolase